MSKQKVKMNNIRRNVKNKLLNCPESLYMYKEERKQIYNLINLTVTAGESNSVLIIGPRGSGKTTLIKNVLRELESTINLEANAIVVELNGLVHTDDKVALKSCTIQMNLENVLDETFSGTFAENLSYLLQCINSGQRNTSKSLLFILEEFDLFCLHNNQTLLYNLLDMTHSSQTPMCVIGLTARLDVVSLFEKRVKSRFSHRQVFLLPEAGPVESRFGRLQRSLQPHMEGVDTASWDAHVDALLADTRFVAAMRRLHELTKCERVLNNILFTMVSRLEGEPKASQRMAETFAELVREYETDSKVRVLGGLSVLELCLLIAMKHHGEIYDHQPFNLEMIRERYGRFVAASSAMAVPRSVVLKAFEHLKSLELVAPVSASANADHQLYQLALPARVLEAACRDPRAALLPTEARHWLDTRPT